MTSTIEPGPIAAALEHAHLRLEQVRFADALRTRKLDVWTSDPTGREKIANRLGWVDALQRMKPHLPQLRAFADSIRAGGFTEVVLLGMGGSSLVSEVLRTVVGVTPGYPRFRVLDSVNPAAIRAAMANPATTLFVIASKSGSTIELTTLAAEAEHRLRSAGIAELGTHFVAITDENTGLHTRAVRDRFRDIFLNPADIGGRFSALSFFGLVPAALMGIDLDAMLAAAAEMEGKCADHDPRRNPGLALGAFMAASALQHRDKLTFRMPPRLIPLGLWIEQLVAESTGKLGKGVLPVIDEPDVPLADDRAVVFMTLAGEQPATRPDAPSNEPICQIDIHDIAALGAEFYRWEVATAAAGWLLGINPFDEPNVQQAKDATRALLDVYIRERRLPIPEPDGTMEGVRLALTGAGREAVDAAGVFGFLNTVRNHDYVAVLAYVPPDDERLAPALKHLRRTIGASTKAATTLGYGPRYLHSTGQLHKGGPNTGVFIIIATEPLEDLAIPGQSYSFATLELAQAVGDFQSLDRAGRRGLLILLPRPDQALLETITQKLLNPPA